MSENPGPASPGAPAHGDEHRRTPADTGPGPDPADVDGPSRPAGADEAEDAPDEG
ncbi:hypothetical protein J1G42_17110 [Cellulomonas sp. zg-ZUI222]|uniref:Uncharacterized protein n=1 Tax=Cellulomonas wangleii TaxID=2816956 RepID=A0ABX8D7H5_9CELL|nr:MULTISPECIES: hypothetical protein [Cellulomonas]MBO0901145.1 hypothetical protein [Cellulomonas sp. zg-ZUI22]MBO0922543.1 hypothetical protein [Cellulomonas wangleii]MBO0926752.1 hypothetical protein [Cellulomonas wangleii]QVI63136.1 hypothetical protein KG103_04285 [Cellulomonas wangleii]